MTSIASHIWEYSLNAAQPLREDSFAFGCCRCVHPLSARA